VSGFEDIRGDGFGGYDTGWRGKWRGMVYSLVDFFLFLNR
jgi:hypothetical protein